MSARERCRNTFHFVSSEWVFACDVSVLCVVCSANSLQRYSLVWLIFRIGFWESMCRCSETKQKSWDWHMHENASRDGFSGLPSRWLPSSSMCNCVVFQMSRIFGRHLLEAEYRRRSLHMTHTLMHTLGNINNDHPSECAFDLVWICDVNVIDIIIHVKQKGIIMVHVGAHAIP